MSVDFASGALVGVIIQSAALLLILYNRINLHKHMMAMKDTKIEELKKRLQSSLNDQYDDFAQSLRKGNSDASAISRLQSELIKANQKNIVLQEELNRAKKSSVGFSQEELKVLRYISHPDKNGGKHGELFIKIQGMVK